MEFGDDFVIVDPFDIDMTYYEGQRSLTALKILFPGLSPCLQVEETGGRPGHSVYSFMMMVALKIIMQSLVLLLSLFSSSLYASNCGKIKRL